MALVNALSLTLNSDINTGVVNDLSNYGVSGNPARNAKANFLLFSKTDKNGNRTYDNPAITNALTQLAYNVNTLIDGWYEGVLMRFNIYDNATAYTSGKSVYYNGSIYTSIASTTGNLPTDPIFWTVIPDLSTLINNSDIDVYTASFYVKVRINECVAKKFEKGCGCGCGCDDDLDKIRPALLLHCMILSSDAAFAAQNYESMEKTIRAATDNCVNC